MYIIFKGLLNFLCYNANKLKKYVDGMHFFDCFGLSLVLVKYKIA